jgi:hypothetical protein
VIAPFVSAPGNRNESPLLRDALPRLNTVNKFEFVLTFKSLQQQEELEGWQERKQRCPAGRGWRTV